MYDGIAAPDVGFRNIRIIEFGRNMVENAWKFRHTEMINALNQE